MSEAGPATEPEGKAGGCTDCGRKGGCDHRKGGMFAAMDEALAALYPSRRWGDRDDTAALGNGVGPERGARLADLLARRLETLALFRPGTADEYCDYVYLLCFGRSPSVLELWQGAASGADVWAEAADEATGLEELHLRVALSALAPFAAVQQVGLSLARRAEGLIVTETPRTGVFDPILLGRYQKVAAALAELDVRNLDFGDLTQPPAGFDGSAYEERFGVPATLANYFFYPQPSSTVTTTLLDPEAPARDHHAPLESP
jgi:hypothetical protein